MTFSLFVRKSKDSNIYVAYGYIKYPVGSWVRKDYVEQMVHFEGNTFMEAITGLSNYYETNTQTI